MMQTSLKMLYWSMLIYDYEEVRLLPVLRLTTISLVVCHI